MEYEAYLVRVEEAGDDRESWAYIKYSHLVNVPRVPSMCQTLILVLES